MPTPDRILQATLESLAPRFTTLAFPFSPLIDKILENKGVSHVDAEAAPYHTFRVLTQGPGRAHHLPSGGEIYASGLRKTPAKGSVYGTRIIYTYEIPGSDMAKGGSPKGAEKLVEQYPELAYADFRQILGKQLMMGDQGKGFLSLLPGTTYSPEGTPYNAVFQNAARAAQNQTVFGLAKEGATPGTTGWYHGYGAITSMVNNGERIFQQVHGEASTALAGMPGVVDLMFADATSYYNYLMHRRTAVFTTGKPEGMSGFEDGREGVDVLGGKMYKEPHIDAADAAIVALGGVIYGLKSKTWELRVWDEGQSGKKAFFHARPLQKMQNKDAWIQEIVFHGQLYSTALPCNFVVVGGQNA
jgi:hypothetical protein